jgi:hypothetical protein
MKRGRKMSNRNVRYTITNDTATVVIDGKTTVVRRGSANFEQVKQNLINGDTDDIESVLSPASAIISWAKDAFKVENGTVYHNDRALPGELTQRILDMTKSGDDPAALLNFWERLQKNPSARSVSQLFPFLQNSGIPITPDGCFLAYKGVRSNYADCYTGTIFNTPGSRHEMERNLISDDPSTACHFGLHVGALEYAANFAQGRVVICKIDPKDVVCIPYDYSHQKMRVCAYEVIGEYGVKLPDTVYDEDSENNFLDDLLDALDSCDDFDDDLYDDNDDADEPSDSIKPMESDQSTKTKHVAPAPKGFARIHRLDSAALMDESMESLRRYAARGLKIVGASRIPGGKSALVMTIVSVRGR